MLCKLVFTLFIGSVIRFSDGVDTQHLFIPDDYAEFGLLSGTCIKCICKVMGCLKDEGCSDGMCGPMHITQGYWESAHHQNADPANRAAFEKCTTNAWCATRTVERHMRRFLPGCEAKRPERLRCETAMALHKFGPERCDRNLTATTKRRLYSCLDKITWSWLED